MKLSQNIKLLGIYQFFYPFKGGSPKYEEELYATLLLNNKNVKIDVLVYNTEKAPLYEEYRGMRIFRVPCIQIVPGRFYMAKPFSLIKTLFKLSKNKYTHVHTDIRYFDTCWWVWLYAKIIGAVSIFTEHNASFAKHEKWYVEFVSKMLDKTIVRYTLPKYDELIYISRATRKFCENCLNIKRKSSLIYNSVNLHSFTNKGKHINRVIPKVHLKLKSSDILVTYVGRVTWTKGLTYYIESIDSLVKLHKNKNLYFVIAGKGDLLTELKKQVKQRGLEKRVFIIGALNYKYVSKLLQISDIFINPSHHNEGLPTTILEAGASGCFVIATNRGGTREVVQNFKTGLLVPEKNPKAYAEAIMWYIKNIEKTEKIKENMYKKIQQTYNWEFSSKKFYSVLIESFKRNLSVETSKFTLTKKVYKLAYSGVTFFIAPFYRP